MNIKKVIGTFLLIPEKNALIKKQMDTIEVIERANEKLHCILTKTRADLDAQIEVSHKQRETIKNLREKNTPIHKTLKQQAIQIEHLKTLNNKLSDQATDMCTTIHNQRAQLKFRKPV